MSDHRNLGAAVPVAKWQLLLLFAACGLVAVLLALQLTGASLRDGVYHPAGNDAFYHARRIIDTAGERGFYEFDDTIHVPQGSQVVWPWAFDYLLGQALGVYLAVNPAAPPMAFLAYIPPLWLLVNLALFIAITGAARLSFGLRAVATLGYAMFPLGQLMHGVGAIDHHFAEHSFVLATVLLALSWAGDFSRRRYAVGLALLLGVATAFHTGLFILQLPLLVGIGLLWMRGRALDRGAMTAFALTLAPTTLISALPSLSLREFDFDFSVLSWFHVYVSLCTSAMLVFFSRSTFNRRQLGIAAAIALALSLPILMSSAVAIAFLGGDILLLDRIEEAQSPLAGLLTTDGVARQSSLYSALILAAPLFTLWFAWRLVRERDAVQLLLAAFATFGLLLLCTQIRLHYFGSFALLIAVPMLLQRYLPTMPRRSWIAGTLGLLVVAVAWQQPLRHQLFARHNLSFDIDYDLAQSLFASLNDACAERPGLALASNNFGHPVRYHSDCSVIANNFLLTALHETKITELKAAWQMTPAELVQAMPDVRYVLVSLNDVFLVGDDGLRTPTLQELGASNPPLAMALIFDRELPEGFELIDERMLDDGRDFAVARLFRINPSTNNDPAATGAG